MVLPYLILACLIAFPADSIASDHEAPNGAVEGHFHIVSPQTVDLADGTLPTVTAETYAAYPLVVLSADGKKEIATVTADAKGNYRLSLPPGEYVLDVKDRVRKHVRAKPQKFTVTADHTVQVNLEMDTGIR